MLSVPQPTHSNAETGFWPSALNRRPSAAAMSGDSERTKHSQRVSMLTSLSRSLAACALSGDRSPRHSSSCSCPHLMPGHSVDHWRCDVAVERKRHDQVCLGLGCPVPIAAAGAHADASLLPGIHACHRRSNIKIARATMPRPAQ